MKDPCLKLLQKLKKITSKRESYRTGTRNFWFIRRNTGSSLNLIHSTLIVWNAWNGIDQAIYLLTYLLACLLAYYVVILLHCNCVVRLRTSLRQPRALALVWSRQEPLVYFHWCHWGQWTLLTFPFPSWRVFLFLSQMSSLCTLISTLHIPSLPRGARLYPHCRTTAFCFLGWVGCFPGVVWMTTFQMTSCSMCLP